MDSSIISIIIVLITMGLFVWNRLPISVVAILGSVAMAMFIPEMELSAVYSGFSATGWPMVVGMCVVSAALFETGIARKIGEKIGNSFLAKTERRFIVTVSAVCSLMSAFMSNNGTVAIWMPIIAIVAANSCGKIRSKMVIFPAGTAAVIGGASLSGGVGTIYGSIIGSMIIGVITNILTLKSVQSYYQMIITGLIIVISVILDIVTKGKKD